MISLRMIPAGIRVWKKRYEYFRDSPLTFHKMEA